MEQYINKSAVMAEIERKKIPFKKDIDDGVYPTYLCALMDFEDFFDTLEVKEEVFDINDIKDAFKSGYDMGVLQTTKKMKSNTKEVEEVEKRTQHHISMEDIEKAAARYDGSMNCVGCFIGGAKWMEQRLKDK